MPLVSAKCPQCGAPLKVDSKNEAAICEYCKTPFIVEKAIHNYNIENANITVNSIDVENLIKLAKEELALCHNEKVFEYATKVLEIDSSNSDGWLLKLQSYQGDISDLIGYGNNAIKYDTTGKIANEVYRAYLGFDYSYDYNLGIHDLIGVVNIIPSEIILQDEYLINAIENKVAGFIDFYCKEIDDSYTIAYTGFLTMDASRISFINGNLELVKKAIHKLPEIKREKIIADAENRAKSVMEERKRQIKEIQSKSNKDALWGCISLIILIFIVISLPFWAMIPTIILYLLFIRMLS